MRPWMLFTTGLLSIFPPGHRIVRAETAAPTLLTIRTYNSFGIPTADLHTAQAIADAIFRRAGVTLRWRDCRTPTAPSAASTDTCDDAVAPFEVVIRIVSAPARRDQRSLGFSYVESNKKTGWLATVFADRITALAARGRLERGALLGRAFAHEVGHLLQGTSTHSRNGLMRGHWDSRISRRNVPDDWLFSAKEATEMQRTLITRAQSSRTATEAELARYSEPGQGQPR